MYRRSASLLLASAVMAATASLPAHAEYFLDARQKGELVSRGQITGRDGALYNVWIVPGYAGPWRDAGQGWRKAGQDVARYGDADLYRDIGRHSRDTFRFSHREILREFAIKGTGRSWRESFATAHGRVEKRVFGWWFAYPWALIEATGSGALRVGLGVPTGVAVGVGSVSVLPLMEFGFPVAKAGYHGVVEGTALPGVAMTWNTVAAPPLALLGQQPAAERADGFWMKRIDPATSDAELLRVRQALAAWRDSQLASPSAQAVTQQATAQETALRERREAVLRQIATEQAAVRDAAQQRLLALLREAAAGNSASAAGGAAAVDGLPARDELAALAARHGRAPLVDSLRSGALDEATAKALLDALLGPETTPPATPPRPDAEKTDPLRRSVELMGK